MELVNSRCNLTDSAYKGITAFLPDDKKKLMLAAMARIAEIAVEKKFGELPVNLVELYQALKDESEARFIDWLNDGISKDSPEYIHNPSEEENA